MTVLDDVSVVIPAKNECMAIANVVARVAALCPDIEIIVVDDGSSDSTAELAALSGAKIIYHKHSLGNGAAVKAGARAASKPVIIFMDGDGQHDVADIPRLISRLEEGYDMVVGARQAGSQASLGRGVANRFYNRLASYMTGHNVQDLTSGFRVVKASKFREFLYLLPNGFSYPTTSTMAFFRAGYSVAYEPIHAARRSGKSHLRPLKDGARFLLIIFKIGTLYSPLKIFAPIAGLIFFVGLIHYLDTYLSSGRFTNMSALMFTFSITTFLMGLISEQITALLYKDSGSDRS